MKIYPAAALLVFTVLLSSCEIEPENVPKSEMVSYRIVVKGVEYDSEKFTLDYVYNSLDGAYMDKRTWYCADYEGTESFCMVDWILSPDPAVFEDSASAGFFFSLKEGEPVPEKIILNTTKPIYMRETVTYFPGIPGTGGSEKDITVARAYFETAEVPITSKE